jgi:hypothetical protein
MRLGGGVSSAFIMQQWKARFLESREAVVPKKKSKRVAL